MTMPIRKDSKPVLGSDSYQAIWMLSQNQDASLGCRRFHMPWNQMGGAVGSFLRVQQSRARSAEIGESS